MSPEFRLGPRQLDLGLKEFESRQDTVLSLFLASSCQVGRKSTQGIEPPLGIHLVEHVHELIQHQRTQLPGRAAIGRISTPPQPIRVSCGQRGPRRR